MRVLFIGGTGNISTAVSRLAVARGVDLTLLNRGRRPHGISGASSLVADISDENSAVRALDGRTWDVVVNWIAFTPEEIERDLRLFAGKTAQYIFISSPFADPDPGRRYVAGTSERVTAAANDFLRGSQTRRH